MPERSENENSFATGCGCLSVGMGFVALAFGLAALFGVRDRIELEFFGIELNDRTGQAVWVAGSLLAITGGFVLLRIKRDE